MRPSAIDLECALDSQHSESSEMTRSHFSTGHGLDCALHPAYTVTLGDLDQRLLDTTSKLALRLVRRDRLYLKSDRH